MAVSRSMLLLAALAAVALPLAMGLTVGPGGQTILTSGTGLIKIEILASEATYLDEIKLASLITNWEIRSLGTNKQPGTIYNIGSFPAGTEVVFGISTPPGAWWLTGPSSRNNDGFQHSKLTVNPDGSITVGFEDRDRRDVDRPESPSTPKDWNDVLFKVIEEAPVGPPSGILSGNCPFYLPAGYKFYPNQDADGNDISCAKRGTLSTDDVAKLCTLNAACKGFNMNVQGDTEWYCLKKVSAPADPSPKWYMPSPCDGFYGKIVA